jgi:hypothetical protein
VLCSYRFARSQVVSDGTAGLSGKCTGYRSGQSITWHCG